MSGWFKVYNAIIDDPKIKAIAFGDRWHFIALLALKNNGTLDEPAELRDELIALSLGLQIKELEGLKKRLQKYRLIDESWQPKSWEKLQTASDKNNAERQRRWREKQAKSKGSDDGALHNALRNGNSNVLEEEIEEEKELLSPPEKKKKIPPSFEEVAAYCRERNNGIDPQKFLDHYGASGWMRGKTKIKDWQACVRTWEGNSKSKGSDTFQADYL